MTMRIALIVLLIGLASSLLMADQTMYLWTDACIRVPPNNYWSLQGIWNSHTDGTGSCSLNSNFAGDPTSKCINGHQMTVNHHKVIGLCDCFRYVTMINQSAADNLCTRFTLGTYAQLPDCL